MLETQDILSMLLLHLLLHVLSNQQELLLLLLTMPCRQGGVRARC